jgi:hypothetical protein
MPLIIPANSITGGYEVDNSVRFNTGSSDSLTKSFGSAGNRAVWTWSAWIKVGSDAGFNGLFTAGDWGGGSTATGVIIYANTFNIYWNNPAGGSATTAKYRDPSAWYHVVLQANTSTLKLYINGTEEISKSISGSGEINNSSTEHAIGKYSNAANTFNGYMSEVCFIDGTALDPTSFGEFDSSSGIWKPIDVSELTFGTNGFYLDFEDSAALGDDVSGNGNDFTVNNLTAIDQTTDTPTNNFATLNGLAIGIDATLSEGNLKMASGTATSRSGTASSIGFSQGKWFAEFKILVSANGIVGIAGTTQNRTATDDDDIGNYPGRTQQGYGYLSDGNVYNDSVAVTGSFDTFTTNDIIGVAVDVDNDLLYFYKNGAIQNSGTGIDISGITPQSGNWFFAVGDGSGATAATVDCNFGNAPYTISSGNTDGNGYGNFEYAVPSGYYSLNTKNLAEFG